MKWVEVFKGRREMNGEGCGWDFMSHVRVIINWKWRDKDKTRWSFCFLIQKKDRQRKNGCSFFSFWVALDMKKWIIKSNRLSKWLKYVGFNLPCHVWNVGASYHQKAHVKEYIFVDFEVWWKNILRQQYFLNKYMVVTLMLGSFEILVGTSRNMSTTQSDLVGSTEWKCNVYYRVLDINRVPPVSTVIPITTAFDLQD